MQKTNPERKRRALGGEGILTHQDLQELNGGVQRVYALMADGQWHNAASIRKAAGNGASASEGLRRLRELREVVDIEKKAGEGRNWYYRMKPKPGSTMVRDGECKAEQGTLFPELR